MTNNKFIRLTAREGDFPILFNAAQIVDVTPNSDDSAIVRTTADRYDGTQVKESFNQVAEELGLLTPTPGAHK